MVEIVFGLSRPPVFVLVGNIISLLYFHRVLVVVVVVGLLFWLNIVYGVSDVSIPYELDLIGTVRNKNSATDTRK